MLTRIETNEFNRINNGNESIKKNKKHVKTHDNRKTTERKNDWKREWRININKINY